MARDPGDAMTGREIVKGWLDLPTQEPWADYVALEQKIDAALAAARAEERTRCTEIVRFGAPEGPVLCDLKACILTSIEAGDKVGAPRRDRAQQERKGRDG